MPNFDHEWYIMFFHSFNFQQECLFHIYAQLSLTFHQNLGQIRVRNEVTSNLPGLVLTNPEAKLLPPVKYLAEWFEKLCCDWPSAIERVFDGFEPPNCDMCECSSSVAHPRVNVPRVWT